MFRITKWIVAPVFAIGLFFAADSPSAKAQGFSISIGNGYGGYGYRDYGYRDYGYQAFRPSYGYGAGYGYGGFAPRPIVVPVPVQPYCPSSGSYYRGGYNNFAPLPGYYNHYRGSAFRF